MKPLMYVIAFIAILFSACKKDALSSSYTPECSGTTKSYVNDVAPVIASNCSSCHSEYSTYSKVKNAASSIRNAIVNGSMPSKGSMSTADKNTVVCWLDNGALNN